MTNRFSNERDQENELQEKLISTNRVAKVVKGGRNFSFNATIVVGDKNGSVGVGFGKANEITDAIRKAKEKATRAMFRVPVVRGTIPHAIIGKYKASRIMLRPAAEGTGIIAGGPARAILEVCGVKKYSDKITWFQYCNQCRKSNR